jgi:hypothetical protein
LLEVREVLPVTSELRATPLLRIVVDRTPIIGELHQDTMVAVERALAAFWGIA